MSWRLIPRGSLLLSYGDAWFATKQALIPDTDERREKLAAEVERVWDPSGHSIVTFSVRSAFDLLLSTLAFPTGSEILMGAVTISDMPKIIKQHNLTPVPVDVIFDTMAPDLSLAEKLISPKTKMMVVAPLFGSKFDMDPFIAFAKKHNILMVQDLAQGYDGFEEKGHPESDAVMFSFGFIKTDTALGGALVTVKDDSLLRQMRENHNEYPVQSQRGHFFLKALKAFVYRTICNQADVLGLFDIVSKMHGRSADYYICNASRSFPGPNLFASIRQRPCSALIATLLRRFRNHDPRDLMVRSHWGRMMCSMVPDTVRVPAQMAPRHNFWVCPVLVKDPDATMKALHANGIDSTASASQLYVVQTPDSIQDDPVRKQYADPVVAKHIMKYLVYIPARPAVPIWALKRISDVLKKTCIVAPPAVPTRMPMARL